MPDRSRIIDLIASHSAELLEEWLKEQFAAVTLRADLLSEAELRRESREFFDLFQDAVASGELASVGVPAWAEARGFLEGLSRSRAEKGFSPSETATFVLSLKGPLFGLLRRALGEDSQALADEMWVATVLLDKLGLLTAEAFIRTRQQVIARQQQEMLELSTPVVKIWNGVLALPLIGTLDSARTQVVMETLLQEIVTTGSRIAIIDITGVPVVDTLVAQHLLKTVAAARLMGAEVLVSGIRPQIAQTMVHLGVGFGDVTTKATLADAIRHAFRSYGLVVGKAQTRA